MKKLLFVFASLLLFSCSSSSDDNNSSNSGYNPPTWIQGTWGIKASDYSTKTPMYKFSTDNVCQISQMSSYCWKETIELYPNMISGSDVSTNTLYEASLIQGKGSVTLTLTFKKVSATKILWTNTGSIDIELDKLD